MSRKIDVHTVSKMSSWCGFRSTSCNKQRTQTRFYGHMSCVSKCGRSTHSMRLATTPRTKGLTKIGRIALICIRTVDVRVLSFHPAFTYYSRIVLNDYHQSCIAYWKFGMFYKFLFFFISNFISFFKGSCRQFRLCHLLFWPWYASHAFLC